MDMQTESFAEYRGKENNSVETFAYSDFDWLFVLMTPILEDAKLLYVM